MTEQFQTPSDSTSLTQDSHDTSQVTPVPHNQGIQEPRKEKSWFRYFWECIFSIKYFSPFGRSNRSELFGFALYDTLLFVINAKFIYPHAQQLAQIISILMIIPCLSLMTRRLHDVNLSGRWILPSISFMLAVFVLIELVPRAPNQTLANMLTESALPKIIIFGLISSVYNLVLMLLLFLPGSADTNRYGDVPG